MNDNANDPVRDSDRPGGDRPAGRGARPMRDATRDPSRDPVDATAATGGTGGATTSAPATIDPETPVGKRDKDAKKKFSDGRKAERRLGMMLVAPAVILMLAVTAYPIIYAAISKRLV